MNAPSHIGWYNMIISAVYAAGPATAFHLTFQLIHLVLALWCLWAGSRAS